MVVNDNSNWLTIDNAAPLTVLVFFKTRTTVGQFDLTTLAPSNLNPVGLRPPANDVKWTVTPQQPSLAFRLQLSCMAGGASEDCYLEVCQSDPATGQLVVLTAIDAGGNALNGNPPGVLKIATEALGGNDILSFEAT